MRYFRAPFLLLAATLVGALHIEAPSAENIACDDGCGHSDKTKRCLPGSGPECTGNKKFYNKKTSKFAVKGNKIPEVKFDIGESYAGTLSIDEDPKGADRFFFWFFPSQNPAAEKEIVIWLQGGPGCSSMRAVLQQHGPFLWPAGTYRPFKNPYSWHKLTNVVYIDQPVGTGFSQGTRPVKDQFDVSAHFLGFWKNFVDTFSLEGYKIYFAGEGYAGQYIPYIARTMLDASDKRHFDVAGVYLNSAQINDFQVLQDVPAVQTLKRFREVIPLSSLAMQDLETTERKCGFLNYKAKFLDHPIKMELRKMIPRPLAPNHIVCNVYDMSMKAILLSNQCFNDYHLTDSCPFKWDAYAFEDLAEGPNDYFNRADVQKAINVPKTAFAANCGRGPNMFPEGDASPPSSYEVLGEVIDRTKNVVIAHGELDYHFFADGVLLSIQNMTWGQRQGFVNPPLAGHPLNFWVPVHNEMERIRLVVFNPGWNDGPLFNTAGAGWQGITTTERGLTFVRVSQAGHSIAQYTPGAAFRQLEFLLGRIPNMEAEAPLYTVNPSE